MSLWLHAATEFKSQKETRKCYYCDKAGHLKADCHKWKKDKENGIKEEQAKTAQDDVESSMVMIIDEDFILEESESAYKVGGTTTDTTSEEYRVSHSAYKSQDEQLEAVGFGEKKSNKWLIDSGCSKHMTWDHSLIQDMHFISPRVVTAADGRRMVCDQAGSISLQVMVDRRVKRLNLHDVLYVPGLCTNLLSVAKATDSGYCVEFGNHSCSFKKGAIQFASATKLNGVYILHMYQTQEKALAIDVNDPTSEKQFTEL